MYGSLRRYVVTPGSSGEMIQRVQEGFVPLVRKVPGFISYTVLQIGEDTLLTLSVFEDEDAAVESNRVASNWVPGNVAQFIRGLPQIMEATVVLHEEA